MAKKKAKATTLSAEEQKILEHFNKFRITHKTEIPEEEYVFKVQGVDCMPLGDLAAVKAEPKKRQNHILEADCCYCL